MIGDEPDNTGEDPDASAEALLQGEGGAGFPLLRALRQDLSRGHLAARYRLARANAGAPGVDEVTFAQIEERGLEAWLAGLREELLSKT